MGRAVHEIYGKDKKGKDITIKLACYREVDRFIDSLRNRPDSHKQVEYIDFTDYKALPIDPVNCFDQEQMDYSKYDELVAALQLSALELAKGAICYTASSDIPFNFIISHRKGRL